MSAPPRPRSRGTPAITASASAICGTFFGFTKLTISSEPLFDAETERSSGPAEAFSTFTAIFERCGLNSAKAW